MFTCPLALAAPALAREVQRYTLNHVREDAVPAVRLYRTMPELALVVEHMFGGWEGIARFSADEHYLATVRPDEQHYGGNAHGGRSAIPCSG